MFSACCRIYAPRYRQANLRAFFPSGGPKATQAYETAYTDVLRAFEYYIERENHGRPFIIASHSQGSLHAMRLLQERVASRPLQRQLVVAYVIGHAVPLEFDRSGIPVCRSATQTGCLVDWNTVKEGTSDGARRESRYIWFEGRYEPLGKRALICVNPLDWSAGGAAAAELNQGSLPGVRPGEAMLPPVPHLTGARCEADGLLHVEIPLTQRGGFSDALTTFGSYHVFDYNLFFVNTRTNARERILAFRAKRS